MASHDVEMGHAREMAASLDFLILSKTSEKRQNSPKTIQNQQKNTKKI